MGVKSRLGDGGSGPDTQASKTSGRLVFDEEGALDKLEGFASLNGPAHYGLPPNEGTITLEKSPWTVPEAVTVDGPEARIFVYRGGETMPWRVAASAT